MPNPLAPARPQVFNATHNRFFNPVLLFLSIADVNSFSLVSRELYLISQAFYLKHLCNHFHVKPINDATDRLSYKTVFYQHYKDCYKGLPTGCNKLAYLIKELIITTEYFSREIDKLVGRFVDNEELWLTIVKWARASRCTRTYFFRLYRIVTHTMLSADLRFKWAVIFNQIFAVKNHLEKGLVSVDHAFMIGYKALDYAATYGHVDVAMLLLRYKASTQDIRVGIARDNSALMVAARHGHNDVFQLLLSSKANIAPLSMSSAFRAALTGGNVSIIQTYLKKGINLNKALMDYAGTGSHYLIPKIAPLIDCSKPELKDGSGQSPLFNVVSQPTGFKAAKALLKAKADVNEAADDGRTPLQVFSLNSNNVEMLQLLLDAKANINAQSSRQDTAAHFAAKRTIRFSKASDAVVLKLLIKLKADLEIQDSTSRTPLAYVSNEEMKAELLLFAKECQRAPKRSVLESNSGGSKARTRYGK